MKNLSHSNQVEDLRIDPLFPTDFERFHLGRVALGLESPDLILAGGHYLNVYTNEVIRGDVWISGRLIAKITLDKCGYDTKTYDVSGKLLTPGFVEGHIHLESSLVDPVNFAKLALQCGVTTICTDFHEVGAIAGKIGIQEMMLATKRTPLKVLQTTPIELPFLPEIQRTLGSLVPAEALELLESEEAVGLAEVMGNKVVEWLTHGKPSDFALLTNATTNRRTPEGHLFHTRGDELDACLAVGVSSDHELRQQDEVVEKVQKGLFVMLRNGTLAREVETLVEVVKSEGLPPEHIGLVTDDMKASDMTPEKYMLKKVRLAISRGISPIDAIKMVTHNVSTHYRLGELLGTLKPGAYADVLIFDSLESLSIERVICSGLFIDDFVSDSDRTPQYSPQLLSTVTRDPLTMDQLRYLPAGFKESNVLAKLIQLNEKNRFTEIIEVNLPVSDGDIDLTKTKENYLYLICANRMHNELVGLGLLKDYGLEEGAVAVSLAHDHHGIVALGRDKESLLCATNRVIELQGGVVLVQEGKVSAELPLPLAGIMSTEPAQEVVERIEFLENRLHECGARWKEPMFFLFWLGMEVAPFYRISDQGLFDSEAQRVIPCVEFNV